MTGWCRVLALAAICGAAATANARAETQVERGRYLATIMDCGGCHTPGTFIGRPDAARYAAGSDIGWFVPGAGVFYPSNLTPDRETGIGTWSEDDVVKALRTGVIPGGRELAPIMPWRAYAKASEADLRALAAYFRTIPAVHHPVPDPTSAEAAKTPYITIAEPGK